MVRTILIMTLAALLAAPASAMSALDPLDPTSSVSSIATLPAGVASTGEDALTSVQDLVRCEKAFSFTLEWWTGETTDVRDRETELVASLTDTLETIVAWVPVTETTEVTTGTAGGLLGLLPVTRTVTRIVGWDPVTEVTETQRLLPIGLAWTEEYIEWTHHTETVYLTLPAGLLAEARGEEGTVVDLCEPTTVLHALPDVCATGTWCSVLPMRDGWYQHLPMVTLLPDGGDGLPVVDADGFIVGTTSLRSLLDETGLSEAAQDDAPAGPGAEQQARTGEVVSEDVDVRPTQSAGLGALLMAAVAALGAVRRLRP